MEEERGKGLWGVPSGNGMALAPMTLMSVDLPDPFMPMNPYLHHPNIHLSSDAFHHPFIVRRV